jgi:uncharacterized membrane protein YkvA (DUF1232 family)
MPRAMVRPMVVTDRLSGAWTRLRDWAARLRIDILALYLAARDPRVPLAAKLVAAAVAAYALSPVDLIPDFIPVLGALDDLIIIPLGIALAVRLVPPEIMQDCRNRAAMLGRRTSYAGAAAIVTLWAAFILLIATALFHGAL